MRPWDDRLHGTVSGQGLSRQWIPVEKGQPIPGERWLHHALRLVTEHSLTARQTTRETPNFLLNEHVLCKKNTNTVIIISIIIITPPPSSQNCQRQGDICVCVSCVDFALFKHSPSPPFHFLNRLSPQLNTSWFFLSLVYICCIPPSDITDSKLSNWTSTHKHCLRRHHFLLLLFPHFLF